jgi:hypothetical protein
MRFIISILLIAILAAVATYFFAWWSVAIVCFIITLIAGLKPGKAFLAGFFGIGVFWLIAAVGHDIPNEHILSQRMAVLFKLPHYSLFILVTVLIGALVGGLAGWSGGLARKGFKPN